VASLRWGLWCRKEDWCIIEYRKASTRSKTKGAI
jgi:hypothetical protein